MYTYATWVAQLANMLPVNPTSSEFQIMVPGCIDYAEQRIYRDLDLQATRIQANTVTSSADRNVALPLTTTGLSFVVVEAVNVFTPANTTTNSRSPLVPVTRDFIDAVYPLQTGSLKGVPQFFAWNDGSSQIVVAPFPDDAYTIEFYGTVRPTPLSSTNTTTVLTEKLPDLWMAATMVYASAYQRDFGSQKDDPRMSQSWEQTYLDLKNSAVVEEFRKRFQSQAWTTMQPNPVATPPRA